MYNMNEDLTASCGETVSSIWLLNTDLADAPLSLVFTGDIGAIEVWLKSSIESTVGCHAWQQCKRSLIIGTETQAITWSMSNLLASCRWSLKFQITSININSHLCCHIIWWMVMPRIFFLSEARGCTCSWASYSKGTSHVHSLNDENKQWWPMP